ncbi:SDR family oxidoreductase [Xinfangfangia sp. CPCC 101601]|uniref:SDR family oxidoreductase n=1 Tax=Pseudogemmobacter lacusdianii TaxID=3069608 RepID=A0ABU0W4X9_9RHOB|nr:SDR family oxidoreductase [Xinfangfangia sp. CPCC 101601]MDQ2068115.1 SDR family oxidoreductase [Xinfangfangia sp. CPCC 101601]
MTTSGFRTIITGASSGIGLATAQKLAKSGHRLTLVDRDAAILEAASKTIDCSDMLLAVGDVTDAARVEEIVAESVARFGGVDGLVTSAGIVRTGTALEVDVETFRAHLDVNVTGSWLYAQAVARHMIKQQSGSIVMIGSVYGAAGAPARAAYCASKGAVHNLVQALAVEWGPLGIRVNAVAPTGVRTPMVQALIDSGSFNTEGVKARTPLGRLAEADEVADGCAFLLSDASRMITGDILRVDGGWLANGYIQSK